MSWDTHPATHPGMSPHIPVLVTVSVLSVGTDWGHWPSWEVPWWEEVGAQVGFVLDVKGCALTQLFHEVRKSEKSKPK